MVSLYAEGTEVGGSEALRLAWPFANLLENALPLKAVGLDEIDEMELVGRRNSGTSKLAWPFVVPLTVGLSLLGPLLLEGSATMDWPAAAPPRMLSDPRVGDGLDWCDKDGTCSDLDRPISTLGVSLASVGLKLKLLKARPLKNEERRLPRPVAVEFVVSAVAEDWMLSTLCNSWQNKAETGRDLGFDGTLTSFACGSETATTVAERLVAAAATGTGGAVATATSSISCLGTTLEDVRAIPMFLSPIRCSSVRVVELPFEDFSGPRDCWLSLLKSNSKPVKLKLGSSTESLSERSGKTEVSPFMLETTLPDLNSRVERGAGKLSERFEPPSDNCGCREFGRNVANKSGF